MPVKKKPQDSTWAKIKALRFFLMPTICVGTIWLAVLDPKILEMFPRIIQLSDDVKNLEDVLPLSPTCFSEAFQLGQIYTELGLPDAEPAAGQAELLAKAQAVLPHRETPVLLSHMAALPKLLKERDAQISVVDRVLGFFSFVNVIWGVSIIGIGESPGMPLCKYSVRVYAHYADRCM